MNTRYPYQVKFRKTRDDGTAGPFEHIGHVSHKRAQDWIDGVRAKGSFTFHGIPEIFPTKR